MRAFEKVFLQPGKSTEVTYDIVDRDLSIWDVDSHAWKVFKICEVVSDPGVGSGG